MSDPTPGTAGTIPDHAAPAGRKPRYPRPMWLRPVREWLAIIGPLVAVAFAISFWLTITEQSLSTTWRGLVLLLVLAVLLTAGAFWAIRDWARERKAMAERFNPLKRGETVEQRWRNNLAQAREQSNRRKEGEALGMLGFSLLRLGRIAEAETTLMESVAVAHAIGDRLRESHSLASLSGCASARGDLGAAEARLRECLAVTLTLTPKDMLLPEDRASAFTPLIPERKVRAVFQQINSYPEAGVLSEIADTYEALGYFLVDERGDQTEGRRMFAEAEARYREEAYYYEQAAQSLGFLARLRADTFENSMRRQALREVKEMRNLQRRTEGAPSASPGDFRPPKRASTPNPPGARHQRLLGVVAHQEGSRIP